MNSYICYAEPLKEILTTIVASNQLHAQWLNTLSFLENCGARKIAACQHPTLVKEEMLKHAAEEFRHAHHLKRQIIKVSSDPIENYALPTLLGGMASYHYLQALDLKISHYLTKDRDFPLHKLRANAYFLATYAIELRAEELYAVYDTVLKAAGSKVSVKAIMLEEKEHLREMQEGLKQIENGEEYAKTACAFESSLCQKWIAALHKFNSFAS